MKAEERALEKKDFELTWEDVSKIISIDQQVCGTMGISDYTHNHQQAMEEVLKRFKERKEMNILITLPKHLLEKIISGEKKYEMRKCLPKNMKLGEDGFFVVEKGTNEVRCWCRVDKVNKSYIDHYSIDWYVSILCVPAEYIEKYANGKKVYLWQIGKVNVLQDLVRDSLYVDKNPQQFAYCPLSYGESY